MEFRDYYETLGVARDAPAEAIRKAYRKLARKYHPDVSKEPDAEKRMKEVNEAHAVLGDPEKRAAYDQLGRHAPGQEFRPPPDWDAGFEHAGHGPAGAQGAEFSDFFAELFGRMGAGPQGLQGDHHARVLLDLEDSYTGATRQISLRAPKVDAQGRVRLEERTLNVKIPRGIREGQVIRLAGQGGGQGRPGDLLLEVQFRPHPHLRVDGRDLRMTLPVAPWEAALGATIPVALPGGAVQVRIPAQAAASGPAGGPSLRLRGKGLPSDPPGDLYIDLRIVTPPPATAKARELYEALAKETAFDARKEDR